jgi:hypothetical protein
MMMMLMMSKIVVRIHVFILLICWVRNINILSVSIIDDSHDNNSVSRNDYKSDIDILSINDDKDYKSSSRSSMNNNGRITNDNNSKKQYRNRVKAAKSNEILNLDKTTINMLANRAIIKILEDHNDFDFDELDSSLKIELLNYIGQILSYSSEEINSYHDNRKIKSNNDYDDDINDVESSDITIYNNQGTEDYVRDIDDVNDDDSTNGDSIVSSLIEDGKKDVDAIYDNNSIWEQLKQQIKSDFAPFLLLIPRPIKIFISNQFDSTYQSLKIITYSAVKPLLVVVNKYVLLFRMKLFHVTNQFNLLFNYIVNKVNVEVDADDGADNSVKSVNKKTGKVVDNSSIISVDHNEINSNSIDATTRDIIRVESVIDEEEVYGELVEI